MTNITPQGRTGCDAMTELTDEAVKALAHRYRFAKDDHERTIDTLVNLYVQLENLLAVHSKPDKQLCCNGHMCGCQGATEYDQAEHYARAALDEARALIAAAQEKRA